MRSRKSSLPQPEQACLPWHPPGLVAGVDEAGRGPLAGPVVAAAVILDDLHPIAGLADSKKLTAARREKLYDEIRAKALCCSIAEASVEEIDQLNILQATLLAMRRAVMGLRLKPAMVLVDGNRLPVLDVPAEAIVKGDALVPAELRMSNRILRNAGYVPPAILELRELRALCEALAAGSEGVDSAATARRLTSLLLRVEAAGLSHVSSAILARLNAPRLKTLTPSPAVTPGA